ncbi:MAG TPA: GAF domain-containing sensor histidine kinase [Thermoanaerobaculia bacterium]|nr:GAF domain-containing sensor histidine kinase [Thermoanaerobaculia bacterium]
MTVHATGARGVHIAMLPEAQSEPANARLEMELRRFRWITVLAPLAIVLAMELLRTAILGGVAWQTRVALDLLLAATFALFGVTMMRAITRINNRLKRQNRELLALHGASVDISSLTSLDAVLNKVVDQARSLAGARFGAVSVVGEDGVIKSFVTSGISHGEREAIGPPPVGHGVLGVVLREGQRLRLDEISKHPRSVGFPPNHPMMHTLLAVPIPCKTPFAGNLYLAEKANGEQFTDDDEKTLERFAVQAAIAIDNAHLHEQVADLAIAQERLRIAHEMHDGLAQVLGYVNTKVQAANLCLSRGQTEDASRQLHELAVAAREAYGDVREAIVDLRTLPNPQQSFAEVMRDYLGRWNEQSGISANLTIDDDIAFTPGTELQLVRIIQESLANVRKHSRATKAGVEVRREDGQLVVTVSDDGIGFNPASPSKSNFPRFGLSTMRERAATIGGQLEIDSVPGRGTTVRLEVPIA